MQLYNLLELLKKILVSKNKKIDLIREFQEQVWSIESSTPEYEILNDLAYDLDYYEPKSNFDINNPFYYGDNRLNDEINEAIDLIHSIKK